MHTAEGAEGFAVECTRVEGAGEVAFGEVEEERETCGGGGDEDGGESSGGMVVCCEGSGRSGYSSNGENDEEAADGVRCNAFDSVEMGRVQMSEGYSSSQWEKGEGSQQGGFYRMIFGDVLLRVSVSRPDLKTPMKRQVTRKSEMTSTADWRP